MPPVGFKPAIPASERPQTDDLDRAATDRQNEIAVYVTYVERNVRNFVLSSFAHYTIQPHMAGYNRGSLAIKTNGKLLVKFYINYAKLHIVTRPTTISQHRTLKLVERMSPPTSLKPLKFAPSPCFS
jgi:hypothetical protein